MYSKSEQIPIKSNLKKCIFLFVNPLIFYQGITLIGLVNGYWVELLLINKAPNVLYKAPSVLFAETRRLKKQQSVR